MEELFVNFEFNPDTEYEINEMNGMEMPGDYLAFMHKHNGGEGEVGNESYMRLVKLEELTEFNNDYQIFEYFPDCFAFGADLGGMLFCYKLKEKIYFSADSCSMSKEDIMFEANSFREFIIGWDKQFEE